MVPYRRALMVDFRTFYHMGLDEAVRDLPTYELEALVESLLSFGSMYLGRIEGEKFMPGFGYEQKLWLRMDSSLEHIRANQVQINSKKKTDAGRYHEYALEPGLEARKALKRRQQFDKQFAQGQKLGGEHTLD